MGVTDTGDHGRGGRRAPSKRTERHELVRPYVLSADSGTDPRPMQRDAREHLTRSAQPTLDWPDDIGQRPGEPTMPDAASAPQPELRSAGSHRASAGGRRLARWMARLGLMNERRRLAAIGAAFAALVIAGGMILYLSEPSAKGLAGAPASAHKLVHRPHAIPTQPTAGQSRAGHSPAPTRSHPTPSPTRSSPAASPKPTSTTTASPTETQVKVSYAVVRQHPHSFQGQFTIVNNGSAAVNGWELVVVLPGDDIRSVSGGSFHTHGDTVYIDPSGSQRSIAPGATVVENFTAHGSTTALAGCTFNGSPC